MAYKKEKLHGCKVCGKLLTKPKYIHCKNHMVNQSYKDKMRKKILSLNKKQSLETRKKISEKQKGDKGNNWQGGKTKPKQQLRQSFEYKEWRRQVFERDNYTCQMCNQKGGRLNAHHKKQVSYNPNDVLEINNGETLCEKCHKKIFIKRPKGKIGKDISINEDERRIIYDWYNGEFGVAKSNKVVFVEDIIPIGNHYHLKKDEIFFLITGEFLEMVLGEKTTYHIPAPYKIIVPRGTYHKFVCSPGSILVGLATELFDANDEIREKI